MVELCGFSEKLFKSGFGDGWLAAVCLPVSVFGRFESLTGGQQEGGVALRGVGGRHSEAYEVTVQAIKHHIYFAHLDAG